MYKKRAARSAAAVVLLFASAYAACTTFEGEPNGPEDGGASDAADASTSDTRVDPTDGGPTDAGVDGADAAIILGETPPIGAVSCNGATCPLGDGCCIGDAGAACTTKSACAGFFLSCLTPATCGSTSVCCFDGARSACATACGGGGAVCQVGSDCATSVCGPVRCSFDAGAPIVPFNLCSNTTVVPATRDGVTCAR